MSVLWEFCELRPAGGFGLIMADPPWRFANYSEKGEAKNPVAHYDCMTLGDIKSLPVQALAANDCVLWLWAINPMLPEAFAVLEAWGFTFKTAGVWCKRTTGGKDAFGTGYVLRSSTEPFLIATRGTPKIASRSVRSIVPSYGTELRPGEGWPDTQITIEAVAREHSRKPEAAFEAAELIAGEVPRIEVFSRAARPGWRAWGNEIGKFDQEGAA